VPQDLQFNPFEPHSLSLSPEAQVPAAVQQPAQFDARHVAMVPQPLTARASAAMTSPAAATVVFMDPVLYFIASMSGQNGPDGMKSCSCRS
jgi:hypothetical protein